MKKEDLRIIYMGTPDFAVATLRAIVENNYRVVAVVTMPDKPIGRGYKMQSSPVKNYAIEKKIPVLQPVSLKDENFLAELKSFRADLQIVVAFRMLPENVWKMPRLGTFNLHASLLPQYRGAAPINWAIINGEKETGVTTFFLQHDIDTGNIILQKKTSINEQDNAGDLHDRLMILGAETVLHTLESILDGSIKSIPQQELQTLKPAPKIFKETCRIDWKQPAQKIVDFVRGLSPYPGAWCELQLPDKSIQVFKIFKTRGIISKSDYTLGTVLTSKTDFRIAVNDGFVQILELQVAGKKRMPIADFLRGFNMLEQCRLIF